MELVCIGSDRPQSELLLQGFTPGTSAPLPMTWTSNCSSSSRDTPPISLKRSEVSHFRVKGHSGFLEE
ncbi:hypothetical protein MATL_G00100830 [Megalops atlanticus]|uniref:Uncharacterized protein n=1 Tax=Megalops atlanticus TaxID=7932 RepID=A0A9D3TAJ4_MEGAT|nr:hypothetical protein MATL_G00100830 [Megalops atlanticus]